MPKPNALGDASRTCSGSTAGRRGDHTATRAVGVSAAPAGVSGQEDRFGRGGETLGHTTQ